MKEKINKTLIALSILLGFTITIFVIYLLSGKNSAFIIFSAICGVVALIIQIVAHLTRLKRLNE